MLSLFCCFPGQDVVDDFLEKFDFDLIVRAHQVVEDGYEFFAGRQLVTLFSAPNYCGEFDNSAAIMTVSARAAWAEGAAAVLCKYAWNLRMLPHSSLFFDELYR